MAILDTDLLLVNRPGDDATYKTTFATLKDNLPAGTIVSENPPGEDVVEQGLLWFDSSIASLFIWYDDGDTAQWVDVYAGAVSGLEIPPPVTVGANPPSGAVEGDLWWDTNKGELYVYYTDSDSEQWVAASPGGIYDGDGSGGGGATVIVGETAPTTRPDGTDLVEGDLWWNNDSTENGGGRMFVYYSNNWVDTSLPGGPGGGEGGSGDGASVSVGEVPPTGSSQGDLWWCSRSIDEGGGRLYIYYEGQWIDASIPGGGGGGGDFSQAEADTLYLSKAAAGDTAAGAITFKELTTHEAGVKVTGGTAVGVGTGFYSNGTNSLQLAINGVEQMRSFNGSSTQFRFGVGGSLDTTSSSIFNAQFLYNGTGHGNQSLTNIQSKVTSDTGITGSSNKVAAIAAAVDNQTGTGIDVIGVESAVETSNAPNGSAYNFYAAGSAPNYFAGSIGVGNLPRGTNIGQAGELTFVGGDNPRIYSSITSNATGHAFASSVSNNTGSRTMMSFNQANLNAPPTLIGFISHDGAEVTYAKTSDYRVKTNVQPLTNASALLAQLNPVTFEYNHQLGTTYQGFIAHELQQVDSKFATGTKDATEAIGTLADYDGTELETDVVEPSAEELEYTEEVETDGVATMVTRTRSWTPSGTRPVYQGVDQTKLIPLLTKALQEALDRIETLEADVATLQGN